GPGLQVISLDLARRAGESMARVDQRSRHVAQRRDSRRQGLRVLRADREQLSGRIELLREITVRESPLEPHSSGDSTAKNAESAERSAENICRREFLCALCVLCG